MFFDFLTQLSRLPKQLALELGCWPWGDDVSETLSNASSRSSSFSAEKKHLLSLDELHEKQRERPYYLTWSDEHFPISEYNWKDDHFIDLSQYSVQDRLIARALTNLRNLKPDYADPEIPYEQSLSLNHVIESLRQLSQDEPNSKWSKKEYYVVAYYSTIREDLGVDGRSLLAELDEAAFREALPSKAFIRYWFGRPDRNGRNLATCIWTNKIDARRTLANGPYHRRAAREGQDLYQKGSIDIREYTLTIDDDVNDWRIELLSRRIHA